MSFPHASARGKISLSVQSIMMFPPTCWRAGYHSYRRALRRDGGDSRWKERWHPEKTSKNKKRREGVGKRRERERDKDLQRFVVRVR